MKIDKTGIMNFALKAGLKDIEDIHPLATPSFIKDEMYKIKTAKGDFIVRFLGKFSQQQVFETLYGSSAQKHVSEILKNQGLGEFPYRKIISVSLKDDIPDVIIYSYLPGEALDPRVPSAKLLSMLNKMFDLLRPVYLSENFSTAGSISFDNLDKGLDENIVEWFGEGLKQRIKKEQNLSYPFSGYFLKYILTGDRLLHLGAARKSIAASIKELALAADPKEYVLVHGDLGGTNALLNNDKVTIIDWGRAHKGDFLLDAAYIAANIGTTYDPRKAIEFLQCSLDKARKDGLNIHNANKRILYHAIDRLFSTLRIFKPDKMGLFLDEVMKMIPQALKTSAWEDQLSGLLSLVDIKYGNDEIL